MRVRVLGISGSPRHANTELLVREALKGAEALGDVETRMISLANYELKPCDGCYLCYGKVRGATEDELCYRHRDADPIIKEMLKTDGIIIGSPVYTWNIPARLKCLMEKCAPMCPALCTEVSYRFRNKVVGSIVVAGGLIEGQESVTQDIWRWAIGLGMLVAGVVSTVGDPYPTSSPFGGLATCGLSPRIHDPRAVSGESSMVGELQMKTARSLGMNVAVVSKIVRAGIEGLKERGIEIPETASFAVITEKVREGSYVERLAKEGRVRLEKPGLRTL